LNFAEQLASKLAGMKQEVSPGLMDSIEADADLNKRKSLNKLNPEL
jgi:hypothetical protein